MSTVIEIKAKEFWPQSVEEGWGEAAATYQVSGTVGFGSVNNCGICLLTNVHGGATLKKQIKPSDIPAAVRNRYICPDWGGWIHLKMQDALDKYVGALNQKFQKEIFDEILDYIKKQPKYNCYLLTAPVNRHSKHRSGGNGQFATDKYTPDTAWFARQLIANKIGYVVQSPVSVNHVHQSMTDFSLVRAWIWYPEWALAFKPDKYLGTGKLATRDYVVEKVAELGNFKTNKVSKSLVEEYVDSYKL